MDSNNDQNSPSRAESAQASGSAGLSDAYKDHGHPPGWKNEHDPRCQACAEIELASPADSDGRWQALFRVKNERDETQSIGVVWFEAYPTDSEISVLQSRLMSENRHAKEISITIGR